MSDRAERDRKAREDFARAIRDNFVVPLGKLAVWLDRQLQRWPWLYERLSDD